MDGSRLFQLYCASCRDGFGATLEQQQQGGTIRPITFISQVPLPNECNWTIFELESGAIIEGIKRLRVYTISIPSRIITDHQALEHLNKVGEHCPGSNGRWNTRMHTISLCSTSRGMATATRTCSLACPWILPSPKFMALAGSLTTKMSSFSLWICTSGL